MSSLFRSHIRLPVTVRARAFAAGRARVSVVVAKYSPQHGFAGEVLQVRAGYARNYLIPQGIALYATKANLKQYAIQADDERLERNRHQREIDNIKKKFAKIQLDFRRRANENQTLYGSITANEVTNLLFEKYNIDISPEKVVMEGIRKPGLHTVSVQIKDGETAALNVNIISLS